VLKLPPGSIRGSETELVPVQLDFDVWAIEQSIDRGYAVATFYSGDIDPDRPDVREGIQPHFQEKGEKPGPHDWGTIAAWAWGLQRAVDYLQTDKDIDRTRIAVVGHSRLGKTALLAGAFDERIALAIPHQAGCGGSAPSRPRSSIVAASPTCPPIISNTNWPRTTVPTSACDDSSDFHLVWVGSKPGGYGIPVREGGRGSS